MTVKNQCVGFVASSATNLTPLVSPSTKKHNDSSGDTPMKHHYEYDIQFLPLNVTNWTLKKWNMAPHGFARIICQTISWLCTLIVAGSYWMSFPPPEFTQFTNLPCSCSFIFNIKGDELYQSSNLSADYFPKMSDYRFKDFF